MPLDRVFDQRAGRLDGGRDEHIASLAMTGRRTVLDVGGFGVGQFGQGKISITLSMKAVAGRGSIAFPNPRNLPTRLGTP